ncbi:MAG TPA: helix-turn-helix domain-containing protein [Labilithrix sp.]|nr:helix-turn-helix domain-containing protein [Labilithrix sp.]
MALKPNELTGIRRERARVLAEALSKETGIPVEGIMGRSHDPEIVPVRHRLWLMLRETGLSFPAIASAVDRDHTTVRAGVLKASGFPTKCSKRVRVAS